MTVRDRTRIIAMLGWRHAFGDSDATSTFTLAGSDAFTVTGAPITDDAAVGELGVEVDISDTASLGASAFGQYGDDASEYGFGANVKVKF
jgi:outer membrane autotransporter protein